MSMSTEEKLGQGSETPQQGDPQGGAPVPDLTAKQISDEAILNEATVKADPAEDGTNTESAVERADVHPDLVAKEDYSVFTINQRRCMILAASFAGWFSPMSGSIYFPALITIAEDLHQTTTNISLTVTTYLIIQGIAPMMIAGFSDKAGRRPAYVICFTIFIIANLALALQNSFAALLILRMLQSAGSSGTIALSNGIVGDVVVSSDRGQYIAFASVGSILGPTLSPLLGGLLSQYLGWHWIFWFLLILSAVFFVPFFLFLPETCRKIVGDGSIPPPWSSWNLSDQIRYKHRAEKGIPVDEQKLRELRKNYKIVIPNPIATLKVLADKETAFIVISTGLALASFYAISTGASAAFHNLYGYDDLHVSLVFIPIGGGSIISAFTTGKIVDWNYRRHAARLNFPIVRNRMTDLSTFPIELARMQIALPLLLLGGLGMMAYGWMIQAQVSVAGPIVIMFLLGYCLIAGFQALNVLMVDIWPGQTATASAANNVLRCLLGAAASAAITPMVAAMGYGWAYTLLAALYLLGLAGPLCAIRYGIRWRREKKEKQERREKAKVVAAAAAARPDEEDEDEEKEKEEEQQDEEKRENTNNNSSSSSRSSRGSVIEPPKDGGEVESPLPTTTTTTTTTIPRRRKNGLSWLLWARGRRGSAGAH